MVFFTFTVPWDRGDSEEKGRFKVIREKAWVYWSNDPAGNE
jgi:hypothetical protein